MLECKYCESTDDESSYSDPPRTLPIDTKSEQSAGTGSKMVEDKMREPSNGDVIVADERLQTVSVASDAESGDRTVKIAVTTGRPVKSNLCNHSTSDLCTDSQHGTDTATRVNLQAVEGASHVSTPPKDVAVPEEGAVSKGASELLTGVVTQKGSEPSLDQSEVLIDQSERKTCTYCERLFSTQKQMWNHMRKMHGHNLARHICNICGRKFLSGPALIRHLKLHKSKNPYFLCSYCQKLFRLQRRLHCHMLLHPEYVQALAQEKIKTSEVTTKSIDVPAKKPTPAILRVGSRAWIRVHLRPWLMEKLSDESIKGLCWANEAKTRFRMPWKFFSNSAQLPFQQKLHQIYIEWAMYTDTFIEREGGLSTVDWSRMKRNLDIALADDSNLLEDCSGRSFDDIDSYRIYIFKDLEPIDESSSLRDRTQGYPGKWCQSLGIRQYDLLCRRLPSNLHGLAVQNGLVLEFYDFWASKSKSKHMLEDILCLILHGFTVRTMHVLVDFVAYLHERRRNLIACGAPGKADKLLQAKFVADKRKLDAAFPEMYLMRGPKVVLTKCQVNISYNENLRFNSCLGRHTVALNITKLCVLKGHLHQRSFLVLTNGIVLELYQFWKKRKEPKAELLRWLTSLVPANALCEEQLFSQITKMEFSCREHEKLGPSGCCAAKRIRSLVFRLTEDGPPVCNKSTSVSSWLSSVGPIDKASAVTSSTPMSSSDITIVPSDNAVSAEKAADAVEKASFRCKEPGCKRRVRYRVGSKSLSVRLMRCSRHKKGVADKRQPDSQPEPIVIEPPWHQPEVGQLHAGDVPTSNCHHAPIFPKMCIVCNFVMLESVGSVNLDSVVPTVWSHLDGMTVRKRLGQVLRRPAVGTNWLCSVCHSTLTQFEGYKQQMMLFTGQFDMSTELRCSSTLPSLLNPVYSIPNPIPSPAAAAAPALALALSTHRHLEIPDSIAESSRNDDAFVIAGNGLHQQNGIDANASATLSEVTRFVSHRQLLPSSTSSESGGRNLSGLARLVEHQQQQDQQHQQQQQQQHQQQQHQEQHQHQQQQQQKQWKQKQWKQQQMKQQQQQQQNKQQQQQQQQQQHQEQQQTQQQQQQQQQYQQQQQHQQFTMTAAGGGIMKSVPRFVHHNHPYLQQQLSLNNKQGPRWKLVMVKEENVNSHHGGMTPGDQESELAGAAQLSSEQGLARALLNTRRTLPQPMPVQVSNPMALLYGPPPLIPTSLIRRSTEFNETPLLRPQDSHLSQDSQHSQHSRPPSGPHLPAAATPSPAPGDFSHPHPQPAPLHNFNYLDSWTNMPPTSDIPPVYRYAEEPQVVEISPIQEYI